MQQSDRQFGLVQNPGGRAYRARVGEGSAGDLLQVGDDFGAFAERVRACPDPYPVLISAAGRPALGRRQRPARDVEGIEGGTVPWRRLRAVRSDGRPWRPSR